jgi:uncharacterized membrane protein
MRKRTFGLALAVGTVAGTAGAGVPAIDVLPFPSYAAKGISPDGSTVVGTHTFDVFAPSRALRWRPPADPESFTGLSGAAVTVAASTDGSLLAGNSSTDSTPAGTFWDAVGDASGLGDSGQIADMTPDGEIVVGSVEAGGFGSIEAMVWSSSSGVVPIGDLAGGLVNGAAKAVSTDGSTIVGCGDTGAMRPARWTHDGMDWVIGELPVPGVEGAAHDVSGGGDVIVGWYREEGKERQAFVLASDDMTDLGEGTADFVSEDGTVIVGHSDVDGLPWIWDAVEGRRPWLGFVTAQGLDVSGWTDVTLAGMSADARSFAGTGFPPGGPGFRTFALWLDPPVTCQGDLDDDDEVDFQDLLLVLFAWGTPDADVDGDGTTDFQDLLLVLFFWGPCV